MQCPSQPLFIGSRKPVTQLVGQVSIFNSESCLCGVWRSPIVLGLTHQCASVLLLSLQFPMMGAGVANIEAMMSQLAICDLANSHESRIHPSRALSSRVDCSNAP